jgi:hypothetical protein
LMVDADVADLQRRLTGGANAIRTGVEQG